MGLFELHRPWAQKIAQNFARRKRICGFDAAALLAAADAALWELLPRWDGVRDFRTFAAMRIVGGLRDWGREMDHLPRALRLRVKDQGPRQVPMSTLQDERRDQGSNRGMQFEAPGTERDREQLIARDQVDRLRRRMPRRLWRILEAYYLRGLTMKAAGAELGVSESRASQLMEDALEAARRGLAG